MDRIHRRKLEILKVENMHRIATTLLLASTLCLTVATAPVAAERCAEGRTASGKCVDPRLARLMRHETLVMTQPKLSYSAPPTMPGDGDVVTPPRDQYEILNLFIKQPTR